MISSGPAAYLGGQPWSAISREERLFCAELFTTARAELPRFIGWLNAQPGMQGCALDGGLSWELAYEVCFYRDLLFAAGQAVRTSRFSDKRTFDLCLFSPRDIVIIEAKAQGGFSSTQNTEFARDKQDVLAVIAQTGRPTSGLTVRIIGLASARYFANVRKYGSGIPDVLDGHISWQALHDSFSPHPAFARAEAVYNR